MSLLIKNARIISNGIADKDIKDIYIENNLISKIDKNIDIKADKVIDAKKMAVLPGFIDIGCKIYETGYESQENIIRLSKAGTKGGYTTITTSSLSKPIVDNKTIVEYINSKIKDKDIINFYPFGNMTKGGEGKEISEIGGMISTGVVAISDGGRYIEDTNILRNIFLYSKMFNVPLITSAIDYYLSKGGSVNYGYMATKLGLVGIPREAEEIALARIITLAKYTKAKVHISCITTEGAVSIIRNAKKEGVNITCSTYPHYFTLKDEAIDNYNTFAKVMPPLKEQKDIDAIIEGLRDGTIDSISSGHNPSAYEKKHVEFERAEFGLSGLEVAFPVSYTRLVKENNFTIEDISMFMSKNPAKILGFEKKGEIKEGFDADIIIIDELVKDRIKGEKFLSRAKYTPYENMEIYGDIKTTIIGENILYNI